MRIAPRSASVRLSVRPHFIHQSFLIKACGTHSRLAGSLVIRALPECGSFVCDDGDGGGGGGNGGVAERSAAERAGLIPLPAAAALN